jgi:RNA polymerase sigma-70 factor, ECF subfamily
VVYNPGSVETERPVEGPPQTDAALVERARDGDASAFGELVTRYRGVATRVARVVAPGADLEDAVQEAFVKAWFALPRFRAGAPFRPWVCRIVANEAKNRARSARRRDALALRAAAVAVGTTASPEATLLDRDEAETLVRAMNRLKPEDRLVLAYRWLFEMSEAEMADALGVAAGTVKSRLSRAMTRLRSQLVEEVTSG